MEKTVAILGAGPSGLVAGKEALENGLRPTLFEKQEDIGGVWNPQTGAVWNTMHANVSKFTTTFGDTLYPDDTEMFPSSSTVFEYLNDYATKWKLRDLIKFNSKVEKVEPFDDDLGSSGWEVTWRTANGVLESQEFSSVIIATGIFASPNIPKIPGLNTFPGKIMHSKEYKNGQEFEGLNVVTIGGSFSGAEIASDLAYYSAKSYHTFTRPFWILRRYLTNQNKQIPLDLHFYTRKFYSQTQEPSQTRKNQGLAKHCKDQQNSSDQYSLKIPEADFVKPINIVISDNYITRVQDKQIVPILGEIEEIQGRNIVFNKGGQSIQDVDVIIFATGFQIDNSFFPQKVLEILKYSPLDTFQPLIIFQECFHPELKNLFFVGMYKGPYFGVIEQQARWACRVISKKVDLPPKKEMEEGLKKELETRNETPRHQLPHPDYVLFADTIAKYNRSFPDLDKLKSDKFTLADALSTGLKMSPSANSLQSKKAAICKMFMEDSVLPSHYNLVDNPRQAWNQMEFLGHFLSQLNKQ